ncbi:MupA/Atu3671 family FMN-dependent luciferase-like monooxygenase [Azospirillum brasilense]|uniref:MupA/Atu3671 family FMN-dependent luciferase-like monooxygenase n=1 Tax=Azospirillum brasilense TaxID=192 RepID=UPI000E0C73B0|nr:MupA/Atu3671 family FMN-dependent luciferase-like monooxygenase [Azospirillum brasilense]
MVPTVEQLLGLEAAPAPAKPAMRFSFLFFSDVRKDRSDAEKYAFVRDVTLFADREGFEAVYIPERHFHEFGSIFSNPAIMAANLIPQTTRVRFRTAGISLPLHHPAEVVEWWAMNDVLSNGRVDLGFGSGWARGDFILAPDHYADRRQICSDQIPIVRKLWRGEAVTFPGPDGEPVAVTTHPRPIQPELNVWLLVTQSDEGFIHAGRQGYNIFTMLYGNNLEVMARKLALYRAARRDAGLEPAGGVVTLMLHTLLLDDRTRVRRAVEEPFSGYIKSALDAHLAAAAKDRGGEPPNEAEKAKILDYAYERYFQTGALFGTVEDGRAIVEQAIAAGVDEIACLLDFGVDYAVATESLGYLARLAEVYRPRA